jgi:hypothetical protein
VHWAQAVLGAGGSKRIACLVHLILVGDLNFSTGYDEVWGESALPDPLAAYFKDLFAKYQLVDVRPAEVMPTWHNGRSGADGIQKILDRVYASDSILNESPGITLGWNSLIFLTMPRFVSIGLWL